MPQNVSICICEERLTLLAVIVLSDNVDLVNAEAVLLLCLLVL